MVTKRLRRSVVKQEAVVAALYALIRDNDDARKNGTQLCTSETLNRGKLVVGLSAIHVTLERIMETFGYVVTEIQ